MMTFNSRYDKGDKVEGPKGIILEKQKKNTKGIISLSLSFKDMVEKPTIYN